MRHLLGGSILSSSSGPSRYTQHNTSQGAPQAGALPAASASAGRAASRGSWPSAGPYASAAINQISSFSIASLSCWICDLSWLPSLVVTLHAITGRDTPQARPSAALEGTNT